MRLLFRRLLKFLAYSAAGVVILLAVAVGLFRLFLPRLPEYQEEIKAWANNAIGVQVEFSGMDARWGLSGPELEFYDAELIRPDSEVRIVAAEEVRVGVGLIRWLVDRTLIVDRIVISETSIDIRQLTDGSYRIQGSSLDELLALRPSSPDSDVKIDIIGERLQLAFMQPGDERPRFFQVPRTRISVDPNRIAMDAAVRLPDDLGREVNIAATQILTMPVDERHWDIFVEAKSVSLQGWSALLPGTREFSSGAGDINLALAFGSNGVRSATAELDLAAISMGTSSTSDVFDLAGRLEASFSAEEWLIAADDIAISFSDHDWPATSLHLEAKQDPSGDIALLDIRATYVDLDDLQAAKQWLPAKSAAELERLAPSGTVVDLAATVSELSSEQPLFDVTAELQNVGIAETDDYPGIRGFSGLLRANRSGGRLQMDATSMQVRASEFVDQLIELDEVVGTVIWRSSEDQTTVLSDGIRIRNSFIESESNVQLNIAHDGSSPQIDLASIWNVSDVATAKRYIPNKVMPQKLYDWFQAALVNGSVERGTTLLRGPLNAFPFDNDEGEFQIKAGVRNMTFRYHPDWPAADNADIDVVLDKARLYTNSNRSVSAGIETVNAKVNIPDLREPVLSIESFAASSLEAIQNFSERSPISRVFGGQLDRVTLDGDASFTLDLLVPLKSVRDFEFTSVIRSNNGDLEIAGFDPPITELIGTVTISRDSISSESLGGRFLGQAVDIQLSKSTDPQFSVIATADGTISAEGVVTDLGLPLRGSVAGAAPYQARVLFPNIKAETPSPLSIEFQSDFQGFEFNLPAPANKPIDVAMPVSGVIRLLPGGEGIETSGTAENRLSWQIAFTRPEQFWDLDRGVVTLGNETPLPATIRGLHIQGATDVVRLHDWLELSKSAEGSNSIAERIRSIDLQIANLHLLGQHLMNHQVRVDRSASDWLVQFSGDDVSGSVFVPYDFDASREMVFEMQRLRLPGDDSVANSLPSIDPRNLPAMTLNAEQFALGDRELGSVNLTLEKIAGGLEATQIQSSDASFDIVATGRWVADDSDPLGSRTYVTATLTSTDVQRTMERLNYEPGIKSDDMGMLFDLNWSGGPRANFFDVLNGEVQVRLGDGQLEEVEPGAGRVFGLMSIVALPRRLSFDFRDVFSKGFGFDDISGTFRIANGRTFTCDLSLDGPAADIGIVGEVDLANRTYDQTAIVSANVGNTLPIVGAVVAGPQVAAGLLIFSQIFKKPLQEMGQVYYGIDGSWDNPNVDSTDAAAFVESGELANCLADVENSTE